MPMTEIGDENNIEACELCNSKEKNILKFGKVYREENCLVHHFCLLFASTLGQNGLDSDGILGFLKEDIEKEVVRGRKVKCSFCKQKGATIGCVRKDCKTSFHYSCSFEKNGLFQFFDTFPSWCFEHRPVQAIFMQESPEVKVKRSCGICLELISDKISTLWAPCCGGFFDSQCVSKLAATSGYFFKCPLCNNKDVFNIEMKKFGIYVPEQDADWENEPGAYSALLERYTHCDAEVCSCEDGRSYDEDDTIYEIILCQSCGSSGIHIQCGKLKLSDPVFLCNVCKGPEMVHEENKGGRRKSLRGKPLDAELNNAPRKLQLEKVIKSPSPSKNPRKNRNSLANLEETKNPENADEKSLPRQGVITPQPVKNEDKPKRGTQKLVTEKKEDPECNVIPLNESKPDQETSELDSKPKRGRKKKVIEQPKQLFENSNETLSQDTDLTEEKYELTGSSKRGKKKAFVLLADTRKPDVKENGIADTTSDSSQHIAESNDNNEDNAKPVSEDSGCIDAPEEELDTELFDLANQINFDFDIPSSPLRQVTNATPSKLRTPIKKSPAKKLPKKNLLEEMSFSPLNKSPRGRLRTPQKTPLTKAEVIVDTSKNLSVIKVDVTSSSRRSGRKSEQVHETKHSAKCALNFSKAVASEIQESKANIKDQELAGEMGLNTLSVNNIKTQTSTLIIKENVSEELKEQNFSKEAEPKNGELSRSARGPRKRDCASTGQSQKGSQPKPCKNKEIKDDMNTSKKPLVIKLGVNNTQVMPNTLPKGPTCESQADVSTNQVLKLSEADLRKNRLEHAKIRVKINELMDELDSSLASKDYAAAEVVKNNLEALKNTQKQQEDMVNGVKSDLKVNPISLTEIKEANPKPTVSGKRKRGEIVNEPTVIAEPKVSQEKASKRLRTNKQPNESISISDHKENKQTEQIKEKGNMNQTEQSPSKRKVRGSLRNMSEKKETDAIENSQSNPELINLRTSVPTKIKSDSRNVKTLICDWEESSEELKDKPKLDVDDEKSVINSLLNSKQKSQLLNNNLLNKRNRSSINSSNNFPETKSQPNTSETLQKTNVGRKSHRKQTSITLNKEKESLSKPSQAVGTMNLEDIRLQNLRINLFNINSKQLVKPIHKTKSRGIILHLNKYLINKSGKPHSKQKLLQTRLDQSIGKMSEDLRNLNQEISKIIAQDKIREKTKIVLHLNLKAKSVTIKTIQSDQKKVVRRSGRPKNETDKETAEAKPKMNKSKVKKDVVSSKCPKIISKNEPRHKSRSLRQKDNDGGTAPYPYATETTLEEELFYQICPLKQTSPPKSHRSQSSGRIGEKRNNTRRILISMQKLGRSPNLDRPLSFVAFTFDGSNLISHETVEELKERTYNTKETQKKQFDNTTSKKKSNAPLKNNLKNPKLQNVRKKKLLIWKSSKLNSRIKTMISKNGTIQMTVNKEITTEVPNGLNVSKYFKIRRTSSFSPASHKSTSPTNRMESLTDNQTQKYKNLEMKKPVVPKLVRESHADDSTSIVEDETVISPMKLKIPKDLWVNAKKDKRPLKQEKKQRSNASPKTVKVKYKNLYGRVIEYAKNLPRKN